MIEVKHLTKKYGDKFALKDVSFTVEPGQVLGFLGPNGAGKSTTMNILTGYLSATEGQAIIGGHDILEEPMEAKRLIGYLPEQPPLYLDMTVKEYLEFVYELKKTTLPKQQHLKEVCDVVKITDVYGRIIKHLSKGYRQRVGLAQALIGNPDVLILDEPTVGLDPKQIIDIRNLIRGLAERHTVILSSHILPEVQAVCDRILVINKGQIVADGTPDNLSAQLSGDHKLMVRIEGPGKRRGETALLPAQCHQRQKAGQAGCGRVRVRGGVAHRNRRAQGDVPAPCGQALAAAFQPQFGADAGGYLPAACQGRGDTSK